MLQVAGHGRALEAWHLLMVATMAGMLLVPSLDEHALVALYLASLFAIGAGWSALWRPALRHLRAAHLRLAVAATAMVAMLVPLGPAEAAAPAGHRAMTGMPGHTDHAAASLPAVATLLLVVALGLVLAASLAPAAASYDARRDARRRGLRGPDDARDGLDAARRVVSRCPYQRSA